ncbi:Probable galacturonosyltransferase 5 [Linum perenne]
MEFTLLKAKRVYKDCTAMAKKLRAMTYTAEEQVQAHKNEATYLLRLAARSTPKGYHCLSLRLTSEYFSLSPDERQFPNQQRVDDPSLHHYAVFSDNLNKVVLFDHDVVVRRDVSGLWDLDLKGKVNGAVETCHDGDPSFRRMEMLINFSDPYVARKFDERACTWAFGMNLFDLKQWRRQDLTSVYHNYLRLVRTNSASSLSLSAIIAFKSWIPIRK